MKTIEQSTLSGLDTIKHALDIHPDARIQARIAHDLSQQVEMGLCRSRPYEIATDLGIAANRTLINLYSYPMFESGCELLRVALVWKARFEGHVQGMDALTSAAADLRAALKRVQPLHIQPDNPVNLVCEARR